MRINRFIHAEAEQPRALGANICGVLIHARPERLDAVRRALGNLAGVEIHQEAPDGRLVVTVEDTPTSWAAETIKRFHEIEGVLSAALVYHHCDESQERGEVSL
ncbi:MAG: chaperone NapD [Rhodospirillales bacterium]|nr:chaperone NapD [Rhodospirillales bacterium]